jgi:hypothetical protein
MLGGAHLADSQQRSQQHKVDGVLVDADRLQDEVFYETRQRDDLQPAPLQSSLRSSCGTDETATRCSSTLDSAAHTSTMSLICCSQSYAAMPHACEKRRAVHLGVGCSSENELCSWLLLVAANSALQSRHPLLRDGNEYARWKLDHVSNASKVLHMIKRIQMCFN